jgi:hypothetical protein
MWLKDEMHIQAEEMVDGLLMRVHGLDKEVVPEK